VRRDPASVRYRTETRNLSNAPVSMCLNLSLTAQFYECSSYILASFQMGAFMHEIQSTGPPGAAQTAVTRTRHWKRQVERAMRELDPESLTRQVQAAEEAIFLRWQEMEKNPGFGDAPELQEISAATNELLSIKTHKLNWPDPFRSPDA
jgi:hypothetical protein